MGDDGSSNMTALQMLQSAAREMQLRQQRRHEQHERVRRSHRAVALAGGGERECERRRKQILDGMIGFSRDGQRGNISRYSRVF